jgi:hypothetical protein
MNMLENIFAWYMHSNYTANSSGEWERCSVLWKREPSVRLISESSSIVPPACARNPLVRWYATADPPDVPRVETDLARGGALPQS